MVGFLLWRVTPTSPMKIGEPLLTSSDGTKTMQNDLQKLANDIIRRSKKIAADLAAIEEGKDIFREATATAGTGLTYTSPDGFVKTKVGSAEKREDILVLNTAVLTAEQKTLLIAAGLIKTDVKVTAARKPGVEVKLTSRPTMAKAA